MNQNDVITTAGYDEIPVSNRAETKRVLKHLIVRAGVFAAIAVGTQIIINQFEKKSDDNEND